MAKSERNVHIDCNLNKMIGLYIDTNAISLKVENGADARRVWETLSEWQMKNCRRMKGTNTFTLYIAHCSPDSLEETLWDYLYV